MLISVCQRASQVLAQIAILLRNLAVLSGYMADSRFIRGFLHIAECSIDGSGIDQWLELNDGVRWILEPHVDNKRIARSEAVNTGNS